MRRWRELGVPLLLELLGCMRAAMEGGGQGGGAGGSGGGAGEGGGGGKRGRAYVQQLFAQSQCFLQVCNCLNEEYPEVRYAA